MRTTSLRTILNSKAMTQTAPPPDVRRGSAPPVVTNVSLGYAPCSGLAQILWAQPTFLFNLDGGAEPRLTSGGGAASR